MKSLKTLIATALFLTINIAHAGVIIGGTRVVYQGEKKETSLNIKNPDKYSYLVQSWIDEDDSNNKKTSFIITPPLFRLGANEENMLRIIHTGDNLPTDRESMYWMNIKTVPATEATPTTNTLQIAIKTRIKLIYRPVGLSDVPEKSTDKLSWRRNGQQLVVTNPTPYYMNFSTVNIGNTMVKDATYVAPMDSASFTIPSNATGNVTWTLISDFGSTGNEHRATL